MSKLNFIVYDTERLIRDFKVEPGFISWHENDTLWVSSCQFTESHLHTNYLGNDGVWRSEWRSWVDERETLPLKVRDYIYKLDKGLLTSLDDLFNDSQNRAGSAYSKAYEHNSFDDAFYSEDLQNTRDGWLGMYANDKEKYPFDAAEYHSNPHMDITSPDVATDTAEHFDKRIKDDKRYMGYVGNDLIEDYNELIEIALQNSLYEDPFDSAMFRNALEGKSALSAGESSIIFNPHREDTKSIHSRIRGGNNYFLEDTNMEEQRNVVAAVTVFAEPIVEENRMRLGMASINVNGVSINSCQIVELPDPASGELKLVVNLPQKMSTTLSGERAYKDIASPIGEHKRTIMNEITEVVASEYQRVSAMPVDERKNAYDWKNLPKPFISENVAISVNRMFVVPNPAPKDTLAFCDVTVGNIKLNDLSIRLNKDNQLSLKSQAYPAKDRDGNAIKDPNTGKAQWNDFVVLGDKALGQKVREKIFDRFENDRNQRAMSRAAYSANIDREKSGAGDKGENTQNKSAKAKDAKEDR
ncbi:MAG: hypothetical protein FWC20_04445 [Oscillospiraceae bacterium]|nr:hypothetical protein [Oscillospiraceae bacterium]MCL2278642.1 hypothetical protein [Oscillospiraceae bacterium]